MSEQNKDQSPDQSHLEKKYFIDQHVYNCPFCNRGSVSYEIIDHSEFDWSRNKPCYIYIVQCESCFKKSMHLSYSVIASRLKSFPHDILFKSEIDIDSNIFYSVPTSFFTIDSRVPRIIRKLITEAEGCLKMNFLTGASACMRKSIYELLAYEKVDGSHYEDMIKTLKGKYPGVGKDLFEILSHIQDMTSDSVHEQSWDHWDSPTIKFIIETLKQILYEIYVLPQEKSDRYTLIGKLREKVNLNKKSKSAEVKNEKEES